MVVWWSFDGRFFFKKSCDPRCRSWPSPQPESIFLDRHPMAHIPGGHVTWYRHGLGKFPCGWTWTFHEAEINFESAGLCLLRYCTTQICQICQHFQEMEGVKWPSMSFMRASSLAKSDKLNDGLFSKLLKRNNNYNGQNNARSDSSWTMSSGSASSNELAHFAMPCSMSKNLSGHKPKEIVTESSMASTRTISTTSFKLCHFCRKACAAETRSSKHLWFLGALVLKGQESAACASHRYINITEQRPWNFSRRIFCSVASASFARNGGQDDVDATTKARGILRMSPNSTGRVPSGSMRWTVPCSFFPPKSARGRKSLSLARRKKISARCSRSRLEAASRYETTSSKVKPCIFNALASTSSSNSPGGIEHES